MMNKLPMFKGYTVDARLKQFRRTNGKHIKFIDFNSEEGDKLLNDYIQHMKKNSKEWKLYLQHY